MHDSLLLNVDTNENKFILEVDKIAYLYDFL